MRVASRIPLPATAENAVAAQDLRGGRKHRGKGLRGVGIIHKDLHAQRMEEPL